MKYQTIWFPLTQFNLDLNDKDKEKPAPRYINYLKSGSIYLNQNVNLFILISKNL